MGDSSRDFRDATPQTIAAQIVAAVRAEMPHQTRAAATAEEGFELNGAFIAITDPKVRAFVIAVLEAVVALPSTLN